MRSKIIYFLLKKRQPQKVAVKIPNLQGRRLCLMNIITQQGNMLSADYMVTCSFLIVPRKY